MKNVIQRKDYCKGVSNIENRRTKEVSLSKTIRINTLLLILLTRII